MRLRIAHSTLYRYDPPATGVIQVLRLTPRNHEGQYVIDWRIDVSLDVKLQAHEDAFGNLTHVFTADGPLPELTVRVDGEVETQNMDGVVRGAVERFPPSLYLRETPLTQVDVAIREFARDINRELSGNLLGSLHALMQRIHGDIALAPDPLPDTTDSAMTAIQTFGRKRGNVRDLTHLFVSCARSIDIPARYVAGYRCVEGEANSRGGDAWAEAFIPDLGWVGFDPANCMCPTDAYVRVAVGLDALGAAPARGTRYGTGNESQAVAITVDQ
jgi:transglutaminase-like putative cysteine protease